MEAADALEIPEVHPDKESPAHDVLVGHKAPVAGIQRVVAVVAHHEVLAFRHLAGDAFDAVESEEHTSELQSHLNLVCRLLLEKKKNKDLVHTYLMLSLHYRFLGISNLYQQPL